MCIAVYLMLFPVGNETESTHASIVANEAPNTGGEHPNSQPEELELARRAVDLCNADLRNNKRRHIGCVLIRNAVVRDNAVYLDPLHNRDLQLQQYPPDGATRHHMKPIRFIHQNGLHASFSAIPAQELIGLAYYQAPVIGAHWINAWHTIADFFVTLFHTVQPLLDHKSNVTWLTRTAKGQLNKGCATPSQCSRLALFEPFSRLFGHRVVFVDDASAGSIYVKHLVVGLNTRCSPIPTEEVGVPLCQSNLRSVRDTLLMLFDIPHVRTVSVEEARCPTVHIMSRQGDYYRHMTPFPDLISEMRRLFAVAYPTCAEALHVIKLSGKMSFREQILSVYNHSVLFAGRGGGTAYSIFVPDGGVYVSVSGFDQWSPYRDLIPKWIHLEHITVDLVHHEDWRKPPLWFGSGKSRYQDPNRAAYLVKPTEVAEKTIGVLKRYFP